MDSFGVAILIDAVRMRLSSRCVRGFASHTRILNSIPQEKRFHPSGVNCSEETALECPRRVSVSFPVATSQTRIRLSPHAPASTRPCRPDSKSSSAAPSVPMAPAAAVAAKFSCEEARRATRGQAWEVQAWPLGKLLCVRCPDGPMSGTIPQDVAPGTVQRSIASCTRGPGETGVFRSSTQNA